MNELSEARALRADAPLPGSDRLAPQRARLTEAFQQETDGRRPAAVRTPIPRRRIVLVTAATAAALAVTGGVVGSLSDYTPGTAPATTGRQLLSAEVGQRAAEGHIGPVNRWFAGTKHIDEIEALCVEILKRLFKANYADHRLVEVTTRVHERNYWFFPPPPAAPFA